MPKVKVNDIEMYYEVHRDGPTLLAREGPYTVSGGGASLSRETGSLPPCREVVHYVFLIW
jgi:hypothetical protein